MPPRKGYVAVVLLAMPGPGCGKMELFTCEPGSCFSDAKPCAELPLSSMDCAGLDDGTSVHVFPWSLTNLGRGAVTVIRVIP